MDRKQTLEKAVKRAIDNGWRFQPFGDRYFPTYITHERLIEKVAEATDNLRLNAVIFNHDFAKALWGEEENLIRELNYALTPMWKYHIQRMVVADDPVKYLGENI